MRYSHTQHAREPLTTDEVDALIKACATADERLVVFTLLETGLRVAEVAAIKRDSIDYQTHRLTVYGKGRVNIGKTQQPKRRVLELSPLLRPLLEPHMLTHDSFDMSVRTIQRLLATVASRARIQRPCSPHVMRHTFAVRAARRGLSLPALQKWLGHVNMTTTAIYLNASPDAVLEEAREKLFK